MNELICSVCEQRIEPTLDGTAEYRHSLPWNDELSLNKGCLGKAVPKAPEPTGDDKVTPQVRCKNCGRFKAMHEGWRWCGEYAPLKHSFFQPDDEPKAPNVIEVAEHVDADANFGGQGWYLYTVVEGEKYDELLETLKAEIAAKNEAERQLAIKDAQLVANFSGREKTEKERDAALAEVKLAWAAATEYKTERDQLQRDLDEMTKDRDLWQDEHQDECPYFIELGHAKRDLDAERRKNDGDK